MAEALKLGYCGICNNVRIWYKEKGRVILTPEYCEFSFVLADGFVYRHAVCSSCINDLTPKKVDDLLERIKINWIEEGAAAPESEVKAFAINEEEAVEKFKEKKDHEFKEFLKEVEKQQKIKDNLKEEKHGT